MKMHLIISPTLFSRNARGVSRTTGLAPFFFSTFFAVPAHTTARPQPFGRSRRF